MAPESSAHSAEEEIAMLNQQDTSMLRYLLRTIVDNDDLKAMEELVDDYEPDGGFECKSECHSDEDDGVETILEKIRDLHFPDRYLSDSGDEAELPPLTKLDRYKQRRQENAKIVAMKKMKDKFDKDERLFEKQLKGGICTCRGKRCIDNVSIDTVWRSRRLYLALNQEIANAARIRSIQNRCGFVEVSLHDRKHQGLYRGFRYLSLYEFLHTIQISTVDQERRVYLEASENWRDL